MVRFSTTFGELIRSEDMISANGSLSFVVRINSIGPELTCARLSQLLLRNKLKNAHLLSVTFRYSPFIYLQSSLCVFCLISFLL